jgi:hypothetical protein
MEERTLLSVSLQFQHVVFDPISNLPYVASADVAAGGNMLDRNSDGQPGGDSVVHFQAQQTAAVQPGPFTSLAPLGGLAFVSPGNTGTIYGGDDQEDWAFFVQGGQWISAVATPVGSNASLALALGGGARVTGNNGQPVVLPPQYISADGVQTVHVTASGLSNFTLDIYRNTSLEAAVGDTTSANPLPIDNSAVDTATGSRYAVVGSNATNVQVPKQLTTTFASNNSLDGNMFDVTTLANPITVTSLDLNLTSGTHTIELYTKAGTYVGSETKASAWTKVATGTLVSTGMNVPMSFSVPNLVLAANAVTGFYVTDTSNSWPMQYTNGANTYSNADLQLSLRVGKAYPFGTTTSPRTWNGTIHYTLATIVPDVDVYTVDLTGKAGHQIDVLMAGQQGVNFSAQLGRMEQHQRLRAFYRRGRLVGRERQPAGQSVGP